MSYKESPGWALIISVSFSPFFPTPGSLFLCAIRHILRSYFSLSSVISSALILYTSLMCWTECRSPTLVQLRERQEMPCDTPAHSVNPTVGAGFTIDVSYILVSAHILPTVFTLITLKCKGMATNSCPLTQINIQSQMNNIVLWCARLPEL